MQNIKKIIIHLGISGITFLIMLILLEFFLIMFPQYTQSYSFPNGLFMNAESPIDFKLVPNFTGKMESSQYNINIKINSKGLRDYEHDINKNKENFRILALGDSYVFGQGVEQEEGFISIIEEKLGVEIIKAGVPGYGQTNELEYYKKEGYSYDPNLVIIFYYMNDNDNNIGTNDREVYAGNLVHGGSLRKLPKWARFAYSYAFTLRTPRLIKYGWNSIVQSFGITSTKSNPEPIEERLFYKYQKKDNKDWVPTRDLFLEFKKIIPKETQLIVAFVPRIEQIENPSYFSSEMDPNMPNKVLKEILTDLNISYIDVTEDMKSYNLTDLHFTLLGDKHFNKYGHLLYAILVTEELGKNITKIAIE